MKDGTRQIKKIDRRNYKVLFIFMVCVFLIPLSIKNPYLIGVGVFVGIHSIIMIGLTLFVGFAGQVSIGHAAFYGIGAYSTAVLTIKCGLSPWIGLGGAILVTGITAFLIGLPTLKLRGHYLAIATLGFSAIVETIMMEWVSITGGADGLINIPRLSFLGFRFAKDFIFFYFVWSIVFLFMWLSFNIVNSRTGRILKSISDSEIGAKTLGMNVVYYKNLVFILSAIYAGIAGWLVAHYITFIAPVSFGIDFSIFLLAMVIIGSKGSIWGSILGAVVYTLVPEYLRAYGEFETAIYGLILVVIMMFLPKGVIISVKEALGNIGLNNYLEKLYLLSLNKLKILRREKNGE